MEAEGCWLGWTEGKEVDGGGWEWGGVSRKCSLMFLHSDRWLFWNELICFSWKPLITTTTITATESNVVVVYCWNNGSTSSHIIFSLFLPLLYTSVIIDVFFLIFYFVLIFVLPIIVVIVFVLFLFFCLLLVRLCAVKSGQKPQWFIINEIEFKKFQTSYL